MDWINEAGNAIVAILGKGGEQALWGLGMYFSYLLLRLVLIGGVIVWIFSQACSVLRGYWVSNSETKRRRISLLSKEVSGRVQESLRDLDGSVNSMCKAFYELEKSVVDLGADPGRFMSQQTAEQPASDSGPASKSSGAEKAGEHDR